MPVYVVKCWQYPVRIVAVMVTFIVSSVTMIQIFVCVLFMSFTENVSKVLLEFGLVVGLFVTRRLVFVSVPQFETGHC